MAEKNGSIPWSKFGMAAGAIVVGLVVYIWTSTVSPSVSAELVGLRRADSLSNARLVMLENKIFADSIKQDRMTDLLLRIVDKLDNRIPAEGPHR